MSLLPISFGAPLILLGLVLLPIIWWLNRLTPPKPTSEPFPPIAILLSILKNDNTPAQSPWWLTLMRVLMCGFIIVALAEPVLNPEERTISKDGPLVIVLDNSWTAAQTWDKRIQTANSMLDAAERDEVPVLVTTTNFAPDNLRVTTALEARQIIAATKPYPLKSFQEDTASSIQTALDGRQIGTLALLAGEAEDDGSMDKITALLELNPANVEFITANNTDLVAIRSIENNSTSLSAQIIRLQNDDANNLEARTYEVVGYDLQARPLMRGEVSFPANQNIAELNIQAPFELINDVVRLTIAGQQNAGASYLLDDNFRRRRVAIFASEVNNIVNPLLTSSHYIERSILPFVDIIKDTKANLSTDIKPLFNQSPSAVIFSDVGTLEPNVEEDLANWVINGGTLIRFAGPKLASAPDPSTRDQSTLLPIRLRQGERQLGGALSWSEPKSMAEFPASSPYYGIPVSQDVLINRQVLAEPDQFLDERTWASLSDGTPLVTAARQGQGLVVLFHISAETTWSNLPLSGQFAEMLKRTINLANTVSIGADTQQGTAFLPPYKVLTENGFLQNADGSINPLEFSSANDMIITPQTYPGLYGNQDAFNAINLLSENDQLNAIEMPDTSIEIAQSFLTGEQPTKVKPLLFALALILLFLDAIAIIIMSGALTRVKIRQQMSSAGSLMLAITTAAMIANFAFAPQATAQDIKVGDAHIIDQLETTHLAYVITGDNQVDRVSKLGLDGLGFYLRTRTAIEPGPAEGVDLKTDELSFYPLIYWPISENAQSPSKEAIANIDNFMKQGGTILFDTRDQLANFGSAGRPSAKTLKLREILFGLDIPPLEPVPNDHVLTKSFYLLEQFPGRFATGPLWVEALRPDRDNGEGLVHAGDGVSPIMITSNDFAAAWAINDQGQYLLPTVPPDDRQRTMAYRVGINIMMYMLTGNYKADQVHLPALLERLGQ